MTNQTTGHTHLGYMSSKCSPLTFEMMHSVILWFLLHSRKPEEDGAS